MRCPPAFHDVMTPSRVLLMIASSEDSTMAASSAVVSSGEAALAIDQPGKREMPRRSQQERPGIRGVKRQRERRRRGTLAPFFLASESPIAIACLRLFTRKRAIAIGLSE